MIFSNLSPSDFETLTADVLSAVHSVAFERYGEGPDGGIDCKHVTAEGNVWIGQAKRYKNVADLLRAMPKEQQKMQALSTPPNRYFLVTACTLTPGNKNAILTAMQPFITSTADIYGADDLEVRLHQYPAIYRKHHRLWLHSVEQLTQYLNQAHYARAGMVHERLWAEAQAYVVHTVQQTTIEQLATHHSCLYCRRWYDFIRLPRRSAEFLKQSRRSFNPGFNQLENFKWAHSFFIYSFFCLVQYSFGLVSVRRLLRVDMPFCQYHFLLFLFLQQ